METLINKDGSLFMVIRNWLDTNYGDALFKHLYEKATWIDNIYGRDGKLYKMKREICLLGDGTHEKYPYHKLPFEVNHWDHCLNSEIKKIKDDICKDGQIQHVIKPFSISNDELIFNSCVVNKYRDHSDYISYHSDFEASGIYNAVVSVSLGSSRTFYIKKNNSFEREMKTVLNHGDLLLMAGNCQKDYQHAIHSEKNSVGSRISLTYRFI